MYQYEYKMNPDPVILRKCTPFCDKNKDCPEHHEMLVAVVNCTDMLGSLSNLDNLKECVEKYSKQGWNKDDDVPDSVVENRYPLIHWAAALGKVHALEWMLATGFNVTSRSTGVGETALHRTILCLYRARAKFTVKELKPKFTKIASLLKDCLLLKDEANGDTPLHTAAGMLVNAEHKPNFFVSCIEIIVYQAKKQADYTDAILNGINDDGETGLHILARGEKQKIDPCCQAVRSLISAGVDRSIRNNDGQTALDIALANGAQPLVEELIRVVEDADPLRLNVDDASSCDVMATYSNLHTPSPPLSIGNPSPRCSTPMSAMNGGDDSLYPKITHVTSVSVKLEPPDENDDEDQLEHTIADDQASNSSMNDGMDSALLKHLGEAGLLGDVSALLARARSRDESNLRRVQTQAKEIDSQIGTKLKEIDRMKLEVATLKSKRKRCDEECGKLNKRLMSCHNALRELPNGNLTTKKSE